MDKTFWQGIINNDFALPGGQPIETLAEELLGYFGSTDPLLRDEFGYMILVNWMEKGFLGPDILRGMIPKMIANLQQGIGEQDTDSVFLRSFSTLHLATLIAQDNEKPYLSEAEVRQAMAAGLDYFQAERDLRGIVTEKGWAHSVAHTADLLKFLSRNPHLNVTDLESILNAITAKLTTVGPMVFGYGEDDRLAHVLDAIMKRQLVALEVLTAWLENLGEPAKSRLRMAENGMDGYAASQNVRNFLRALYFQIDFAEHRRPLADELLVVLKKSLSAYGWYKFE
ncbi:MAG: DUF2785 domain-containing protein [Chloroflexi bacterium]|nr:DUF2785 domain-containing protein [Chloroflexota bacterium]